MSEGKWLHHLTATTPAADAARKMLRVRLSTVAHFLNLALRAFEKDTEFVHQLRVGARRAVTALDVFASCLPAKIYRRARRKLRRLRRAAGRARDWDVFLLALDRDAPLLPGKEFLLGYALGQRLLAQERLETAAGGFRAGFARFARKVVKAVRPPQAGRRGRVLLDLAQPLLAKQLKHFDRAAARNPNNLEYLHRARIAGKKLRYTMEVFANCYAASFREKLYPAVEEVQEILGRFNDSQMASLRLTALKDRLRAFHPKEWKQFRPEIEALLRRHQSVLPREKRNFMKWWKQWKSAEAGQEFWTMLGNAGREQGW